MHKYKMKGVRVDNQSSSTVSDDRVLLHEKSLGKGSYGMVCRYRRHTGATVAVKYMVVSKDGITSLLEASIMSTYIHPNINSSIEIAYARPYFFILQEAVSYTHLRAHETD